MMHGRRCLRVGCRGRVGFEVKWLYDTYASSHDKTVYVQLYNQLRFFAFLFDGEKACQAIWLPEKRGTSWNRIPFSRSFIFFLRGVGVLVIGGSKS